jgi:N6-adenosine-specific RNA methylase IME4
MKRSQKQAVESLRRKRKKYNIIYADPPWRYNDRRTGTKFGGGAESHYPTMSLKEIKELPVQHIAADNCVLFMWVTFPLLPECLEVIKSWGFKYKTLGFSWHKTNKNNGKLFFGVGSYTKSNAEVCLMAIKGKVGIKKTPGVKKLITKSNYVSSAINAPKGRHSEKPKEIRDRIVQLFGDVPRIELFARKKSKGWDVWGNQV